MSLRTLINLFGWLLFSESVCNLFCVDCRCSWIFVVSFDEGVEVCIGVYYQGDQVDGLMLGIV